MTALILGDTGISFTSIIILPPILDYTVFQNSSERYPGNKTERNLYSE